MQVQGQAQGRGQQHWRPLAQQEADGAIGRFADPATRLAVQGMKQWPQQRQRRIEQGQEIQEPQVRKREATQAEALGRRFLGRHLAAVGDHRADDHGHDDRCEQQRPAGQQRDANALGTVAEEARRAQLVEADTRHETRQQEKGQHAQHVDHVEQQRQRRAALHIVDQPDALAGKEGQCRVQHHAEQQGESAHRVEAVQACGVRRHGVPVGLHGVSLGFR
jgi:hypothetical protein